MTGVEPANIWSTTRPLTVCVQPTKLVHLSRIELASADYRSAALPLSYKWMVEVARIELAISCSRNTRLTPGLHLVKSWSGWRDSNSRPSRPKRDRLPLTYIPIAEEAGIEPAELLRPAV